MELLPRWVLLSLIVSFSSAGSKLVNEYFKADSHALVFWRWFLPFIYAIPFTFFIPWPTDILFYLPLIILSCMIIYIDIMYFNVAKKYGAGVLSRVVPLGLFISFIGWFMVEPSQIRLYLESPIYALGVVISLGSIVYFAGMLRHCKISKSVIIIMLPAILLYGLFGIFVKFAMEHTENIYQGILYCIVVQGGCITFITFLKERIKKRKLSRFLQKEVIQAGFYLSIFAVLSIACGAYAFSLVENPAYSSAITMLSPFWIILIYKIIDRKEDGVDVRSGLFLVASVIALVILKGML